MQNLVTRWDEKYARIIQTKKLNSQESVQKLVVSTHRPWCQVERKTRPDVPPWCHRRSRCRKDPALVAAAAAATAAAAVVVLAAAPAAPLPASAHKETKTCQGMLKHRQRRRKKTGTTTVNKKNSASTRVTIGMMDPFWCSRRDSLTAWLSITAITVSSADAKLHFKATKYRGATIMAKPGSGSTG